MNEMNRKLLIDYMHSFSSDHHYVAFVHENEVTLDGQFTYEQVLEIAHMIELVQEKQLELSRREVNE